MHSWHSCSSVEGGREGGRNGEEGLVRMRRGWGDATQQDKRSVTHRGVVNRSVGES